MNWPHLISPAQSKKRKIRHLHSVPEGKEGQLSGHEVNSKAMRLKFEVDGLDLNPAQIQ